MGSRIDHRAVFSQDVEVVLAAVAGEEALRARLEYLGGKNAELLRFTPAGEGVSFALRQGIAAEKLPPAVRTFHKGDLMVEREQRWTKSGEGYTGNATAVVTGVPGEITARTSLKREGDETVLNNLGEVIVRIPLLGGKLESVIAEQVTKLLEREAEFTAKWLAGNA